MVLNDSPPGECPAGFLSTAPQVAERSGLTAARAEG